MRFNLDLVCNELFPYQHSIQKVNTNSATDVKNKGKIVVSAWYFLSFLDKVQTLVSVSL